MCPVSSLLSPWFLGCRAPSSLFGTVSVQVAFQWAHLHLPTPKIKRLHCVPSAMQWHPVRLLKCQCPKLEIQYITRLKSWIELFVYVTLGFVVVSPLSPAPRHMRLRLCACNECLFTVSLQWFTLRVTVEDCAAMTYFNCTWLQNVALRQFQWFLCQEGVCTFFLF